MTVAHNYVQPLGELGRSGRLVSSIDDPALINEIIKFREKRQPIQASDPMDEFSIHYALRDKFGEIIASIMMTRLGGSTLIVEDQLVPIPEEYRHVFRYISCLVSDRNLKAMMNIIASALHHETASGGRVFMSVSHSTNAPTFVKLGMRHCGGHSQIVHPRTNRKCELLLAVAGVLEPSATLSAALGEWDEEERRGLDGYLKKVGYYEGKFSRRISNKTSGAATEDNRRFRGKFDNKATAGR